MIDVPELDLYLKTFYYVFNFDSEIFRSIRFSEGLRHWGNYFQNNQGILRRFENVVEHPDHGFNFELGRARSMFGPREVTTYDPVLTHKAQFLKIYPRLLYQYGFINTPQNLNSYNYFFRYIPKMVVPIYHNISGNPEPVLSPSQLWTEGTCLSVNGQVSISYNVAVEVSLRTIIEEELHVQIPDLHGTNTVTETVERIQREMPDLKAEMEANLNRILTTEEKRFANAGEAIRIDMASELRLLEDFVTTFEREVIESTELNFAELERAARSRGPPSI
jgi:hypothetical protein